MRTIPGAEEREHRASHPREVQRAATNSRGGRKRVGERRRRGRKRGERQWNEAGGRNALRNAGA
eukprot:3572300-Rhodomonas_salina.3